MEKVKRFIFFWLPPVLWMGLIYFLSSFHKLQASPVGWQDFIIRKTAHFIEYTILCLLYNRGLKNTVNLTLSRRLLLALALTILYAISDEFHQTFVSGRTGKFFDIGVDFSGASMGTILSWKIVKFLPKKIQELVL